jgi:hypothetical protein
MRAPGPFGRAGRIAKEAVLIRHIVFFSAKADEDVAAIKAGLELLGEIPHSSVFEVALNSKVDPLCDAIDVVVYAEFADQTALAAYKAHPKYGEGHAKSEAAQRVALLR